MTAQGKTNKTGTTAKAGAPPAKSQPAPDIPLRQIALDTVNAARYCDCAKQTFLDAVLRGDIAYCTVSNGKQRVRRVFLPEDLHAWLLRNRTPANGEMA